MNDQLAQELVRRITDLERRERERVGKTPLFDISNENTPAQLTGDQNNYDPGDYEVLRLSSSLAVNITGFAGGKKGRFIELINVGSYNIVLRHENASSDAANRILITAATATILPNGRGRIYYDSTSARWRWGF